MRRSVEEEIAALAILSPAQLRERWAALTGNSAPSVSAKLLRLALACELQVREHGGLCRRAQQRLDQALAARTDTRPAPAGSRLVREWNGTAHVVIIGEAGVIRWNEREWRSLSAVARAITGTRWSGPAFFGLKRRVAA